MKKICNPRDEHVALTGFRVAECPARAAVLLHAETTSADVVLRSPPGPQSAGSRGTRCEPDFPSGPVDRWVTNKEAS
jgi:hypothetical protein